MLKKYLSAVFTLGALSLSLAQEPANGFPDLIIGEWRQHLPWQRVSYVTQSETKAYCATEWAVVEVDKADRSPRFLTKVEGLSDVGVQLVRFNQAAGVLLIAYANSNLDLWYPTDGHTVNLPFIFNNRNLIGDRTVYDVAFDGAFAYLACGFGLIKLDLNRAEVVYTTFTDIPVRAVARFQGNLYIGTEEGLYALPENDLNPADFGRWSVLDPQTGFPGATAVTALCNTGSEMLIGAGRSLYRFDGALATLLEQHPSQEVVYITHEGPGTVIGWRLNFNGRVVYREPDGAQYEIMYACDAIRPLYCIEDGARRFWFADFADDFRFYDHNTGQCDRFRYDSPYTHQSSEIAMANGRVLVSTPGYDVNLNPTYSADGIYIFENNTWRRFSVVSNPELLDGDCGKSMWRVEPHPVDNTFYAGSFVGGLVEATEGGAQTKCYNQYNSTLQNAGLSGANRTAIGGMAFDAQGNLWICNYDAASPIAVLKPDGVMRHFTGAPVNELLRVVIDASGYKWFVPAFNTGVLVYDSGADLDDPSDDRYRLINTSNSVLPTNTVNSIAVDLDGDVWVGTQQGAVSFECGSNVFDPNCRGTRRIVTVDDFNGYLLETEEVRAVAVDGANRKWFGTNNGIFVQSPAGDQQIAQYTATNSPLFDNAITDIAIDPATGEVWIGTERGLQTLRGEATAGGRINSTQPYAYPNPVRPDYDGPIAIYGLARDANVKITDIAGNLVYEGTALGGQAIWNGRDYLGRRAASGVYLIFATSSETFDNPDAVIAKVVILN